MRLRVMFCRCNARRSTSIRRLPRKSSGSGARPASRKPTTRNSHWQNCARCLARAVPDVEHALRYYGAVLSIPACSGYEPADLGSPSERERAFQVFIDVLIAASRKRPILVIVEDVQWMDPTSIELLVRVVARCSGERIMILITHRDDYQADWLSGPAIRRIALQKLAMHECEQMVAAVAGSDFVPRRIIQPDRGKNRRRATLRRGVYAGHRRFRSGRAAPLTALCRAGNCRTSGAGKYSRFTDGAP